MNASSFFFDLFMNPSKGSLSSTADRLLPSSLPTPLSLFTAYCLLSTAYCLLPTAYCLLRSAYSAPPTPLRTAPKIASFTVRSLPLRRFDDYNRLLII